MPTDRELISRASQLIDRQFYGVLTTVDEQGVPHSRYMGATTAGRGVQKIYTMTTSHSRKLEQIGGNPAVCWVFADEQLEEVVTLMGEANPVPAPVGTPQVWDRLVRAARYYSMEMLSQQEEVEYRAIETRVHTMEFLSPALGLVTPQRVSLEEMGDAGEAQ